MKKFVLVIHREGLLPQLFRYRETIGGVDYYDEIEVTCDKEDRPNRTEDL